MLVCLYLHILPGKKDDAQKSQEDLVNTRLIYEAFRNLTPLQASNKYMWTYLCHAVPEYRAYIQDRWMQEERSNTIKNRFFVTTPGSLLNDNALSRLWWYGYLTYDRHSSNVLELLCKSLKESDDGNVVSDIKWMLENALITPEEEAFLNGQEGIRKIRNIMTHRNLYEYYFEDDGIVYSFADSETWDIAYANYAPQIIEIMYNAIVNKE